MYSVLTRVATHLHLNDCIGARDGQRGIEARTGPGVMSHMNALPEKSKWGVCSGVIH